MRFSLWLILIFAFSAGMCCAIAVRIFYFEAVPVAEETAEPTTKILVAKRIIPTGIEITADFVVFQEVPLSEVPTGSLTSFAQAYRHQPAYPIPAGFPVCEDMLLPPIITTVETAFVPTGKQIVAFDVVSLRQGDRVLTSENSISKVLSTDQHVDIRIVPIEAQGELAEKRNALLRTFGSSQGLQNSGDLILENVPIHRVHRTIVADQTGLIRDSLELVLDQNEVAKLMQVARKGQIRILVRPEEKVPPKPMENIIEVASASVETSPISQPLKQQPVMDHIFVQIPLPPIPTETNPTAPTEQVQGVAPIPEDAFSIISLPDSAVESNAKTMLPLVEVEDILPIDSQPDNLAGAEESDAIRNEGFVAFGTLPPRSISPKLAAVTVQNPVAAQFSAPRNEWSANATPRTGQKIETPRVTSTIQFSNTVPTRELPQDRAWQAESALMSPVMPLVMPSIVSVPRATLGKIPEYTPFERRAYTVPSGEEFLAPLPLLQNSDNGMLTP